MDSSSKSSGESSPLPPVAVVTTIVTTNDDDPHDDMKEDKPTTTKSPMLTLSSLNVSSGNGFLGADLLSAPTLGNMLPPKLNVVKKSRVLVNPGKSMVEWMKIQQELSTKGAPTKLRKIGIDELATHNTIGDCWMALNDKVYDVSEYVRYHPGGVEELMKGAGIDGTQLFNQIHRWVNYESILKANLLGFLVRHNTLALITKLKARTQMTTEHQTEEQSLIPKTTFTEDEDSLFLEVDSELSQSQECWTVGVLNKERLVLKVVLKPPELWMAHLQLLETLKDDQIKITFQNDFRRALIQLKKPKRERWKALGAPLDDNNKLLDSRGAVEDMYPAQLLRKVQLTHNVFLFTFKVSPSAVLGVPLGFHLRIRINGVSRKYTPASQSIQDRFSCNTSGQDFHFIIKVYESGELTPLIDSLKLHDSSVLEMGCPGGSFDPNFLICTSNIIILAAGSGITPFVRMIQYLLQEKQRDRTEIKKLILIFFNETPKDIIWHEEWKCLEQKEPGWFHYFPVISKPQNADNNIDKWTGLTGRISVELLQSCLKNSLSNSSNGIEQDGSKKVLICGSYGFNDSCKEVLRRINLPSNDVFVFTG